MIAGFEADHLQLLERPGGESAQSLGCHTAATRFGGDDVPELRRPRHAIDLRSQGEAEKGAVVTDDRERLTRSGPPLLLVDLEPRLREVRRHRLGDAREAEVVRVVEHRSDGRDVLDPERLEADRRFRQLGSSTPGSGGASAAASAGGSEGIDGGSGAVAGAAGSLGAEEPESPRSHSISLLSMRAMLQGGPAGR